MQNWTFGPCCSNFKSIQKINFLRILSPKNSKIAMKITLVTEKIWKTKKNEEKTWGKQVKVLHIFLLGNICFETTTRFQFAFYRHWHRSLFRSFTIVRCVVIFNEYYSIRQDSGILRAIWLTFSNVPRCVVLPCQKRLL